MRAARLVRSISRTRSRRRKSRLTVACIAIANDRLNAADDRGAAPEGDDGDIRSARPLHHGASHPPRSPEWRRGPARWRSRAQRRGPSRDTTFHKCAGPLIRIGREHVGNRAGRRYTRRTQADVRQSRWGDESWLDAKTISEEAEQPISLRFVEARVLDPPAIELQAVTHRLSPFRVTPSNTPTKDRRDSDALKAKRALASNSLLKTMSPLSSHRNASTSL